MNIFSVRVIICLLLGCIGIYTGVELKRTVKADVNFPDANSQQTLVEIQSPDPDMSPAEVVRLQVDALQRFRDDKSAIRQCYALASPANRAVTGPLDHFGAMVQNQTFRALVLETGTLIGRPLIRGRQAAVLVTVLSANRTVSVFRFFLSKQTDSHVNGCWMTDAVIPTSGPWLPIPASSPDSAA